MPEWRMNDDPFIQGIHGNSFYIQTVDLRNITCGLKTIERDDGWRGFRIQGVLDFSLIGILSKLSGILAEHKIGIFAVSTYNTDYILVKEANFNRAWKKTKRSTGTTNFAPRKGRIMDFPRFLAVMDGTNGNV